MLATAVLEVDHASKPSNAIIKLEPGDLWREDEEGGRKGLQVVGKPGVVQLVKRQPDNCGSPLHEFLQNGVLGASCIRIKWQTDPQGRHCSRARYDHSD